MDARKHERGVTFIELMVTLSVAAVLGALAVPSLTSFHQNAVRTTTMNALLHTVYLARSESIKRNAVIGVCRSKDGKTCANTDPNWNGGWIVFQNKDDEQPADTDPGESILFIHGALPTGTLTSNRVAFSFRPASQGGSNGTLVYCPAPLSNRGRAVIVSHSGRPRISDRDTNGKPIKC